MRHRVDRSDNIVTSVLTQLATMNKSLYVVLAEAVEVNGVPSRRSLQDSRRILAGRSSTANELSGYIRLTAIRWLLKAGRAEEARVILKRIRGELDAESADENIETEFQAIVDAVELERKHSQLNSYWSMFWGIGKWVQARLLNGRLYPTL